MTRRTLLVTLPLFALVALFFRAWTLWPLAIDVDEAWFAASGASLESPFDFFSVVPDNKPPGTVWLYWLVDRLVGARGDPRPARAACIMLVMIASWLVGRITMGIAGAYRGQKTRLGLSVLGWFAALACFLASGLPGPEMLATTSEAIMLPGLCLAPWALFDPGRGNGRLRWLLAGLALGGCLLVKQNAIFFVPFGIALLAQAFREKKADAVAACAFVAGLVILPGLLLRELGAESFWYWCFVYPSSVLVPARGALFDQTRAALLNVALVGLAWFPLWFKLRRVSERVDATARWVLALWVVASAGAVAFGFGLFLHYFLYLVPPLAVLFALSWDRWADRLVSSRALGWLASAFAVVCLIASSPRLAVLWGTDLAYYSRLGEAIRALTLPEHRVLVWGGNALPLAVSGRRPMPGFVTSRFAAPPYGTPALEARFRERFEQQPPELVVDLHERGDDRFNCPVAEKSWLERRLRREYVEYHDPWLPWVRFHLRADLERGARRPAASAGTLMRGARGAEQDSFEKAYDELLKRVGAMLQRPSWEIFESSVRALPVLLQAWDGLRVLADSDPALASDPVFLAVRESIGESLTRFGTGRLSSEDREQAHASLTWIRRQLEWRNRPLPESMSSWSWWPTLALVKLQPVSLPR